MHSHGSKLFVKWDGNTEEQIAKCRVLTGPDSQWKEVDDSHLDMADPIHESSPGLEKPGKLALECIFTQDQFAKFLTSARARLKYPWRVLLPNGAQDEGFAWVEKVGKDIKMDDNIMMKVDLQVSGKWEFTPAP